MTGFTPKTVQRIWDRDGGCCAWCGEPILGERGWAWSVHHRMPRNSGGTRRPWVNGAANGVLLHGHGTAGCHGRVESNREEARELGFLVSANGVARPTHVLIRHAVLGVGYLLDLPPWFEAHGDPPF